MATLALFAALSAFAPTPAYALLALGSATPNQGTTAGGTVVDIVALDAITGTIESIEFGGVPATNIQLVNLFTIRCTAPAHAAGHVDIIVRVRDTVLGLPVDQNLAVTGGYDYFDPPQITSVAPTSGPVAGGTTVTILGANFRSGGPNAQTPGGMVVRFGPNLATNVILNNANQLTATTPAGPAGLVNVTVTNGENEAGVLSNGFTYIGTQSSPTITSIAPTSGPQTGGTDILINGTGFVPGAIVMICGQQVAVLGLTATAINTVTPACPPGPVTITVTNPDGGTASSVGGFTSLTTSTPTVGGVTPNSASPSGGTPIAITGTDFRAGATVTIGCGAASNVVVVNATTITAVTPACPEGTANVVVTNSDGGTATLSGGFTFGAPTPTVGTVSPNNGSTSGGTLVTVFGTNFGAGAAVTFGSNPGTNTQVINPTTLRTLTPPSGVAGPVSVRVQNTDGRFGTAANAFTYNSSPNLCVGDTDCDGLSDTCELKFGLNPLSGAGNDGANGDPDGDGKTNLQECTDGTNPRGMFKRYMAEGATGPFFDMEIELLNVTDQTGIVLLEYQPQFPDPQFPQPSDYIIMPPHSRRTVNPEANPAMAIMVERSMYFDLPGQVRAGGTASAAVPALSPQWFFAEGASGPFFNTYFLIENPNPAQVTVRATYLPISARRSRRTT